jgi:hypothetical protein
MNNQMEVTAAQIIGDLKDRESSQLANHLVHRLAAKQPIARYNDTNVYNFGNFSHGYVVLFDGEMVHYFVEYKKVKNDSLRFGRQIYVWRNPESGLPSAGFARHVMFNILLPKFGALITDKLQTRKGASLWSNALAYAFASGGLHCYFYDRRTSPSKLIPLYDQEDIGAWGKEIWGNGPDFQLTFAIISQRPMSLKDQKE